MKITSLTAVLLIHPLRSASLKTDTVYVCVCASTHIAVCMWL